MPDVYFNERKLPKHLKKEYVAFLDIMGIQNRMKMSLRDTSNFIFKLHASVIAALRDKRYEGVFCYPLMDGVYITSRSKESMVNILVRIYRELAQVLIEEDKMEHIFLVRAAVAYGQIIHGHDIPLGASKIFELDVGYKDKILLGTPMILAYENEKNAAPMGIYLDQSAIVSDDKERGGCFATDWKWWCKTNGSGLKVPEGLQTKVRDKLEQYFEWIEKDGNKFGEGYEEKRLEKHRNMVREYFK